MDPTWVRDHLKNADGTKDTLVDRHEEQHPHSALRILLINNTGNVIHTNASAVRQGICQADNQHSQPFREQGGRSRARLKILESVCGTL